MVVYRDLFKIINKAGPSYYSGPTFIEKVQEIKHDFPSYGELLEVRRNSGASTSRKDYFKDILLGLNDEQKHWLVLSILDDVEKKGHAPCTELRAMIGGTLSAPVATIPIGTWNSERLQTFLREMDVALENRKPERVLTLSYTCMEGFFKAYVRKHVPDEEGENEITALAKIIREDLKAKKKEYPGEAFNVVTQTGYAINRVRDGFSESHFGGEADVWLAMYIRDLVNTHIRLLLHFL